MTKVVILGSGFGGMESALRLREMNHSLDIRVIDKSAYFTYQVSLHKVMVGNLKRSDIMINLENLYRKERIIFYKDEIIQVRPWDKIVVTGSRHLEFDYLVIAVGGVTNYFGTQGIKEYAFELKNVFDAEKIYRQVQNDLDKAKFYKEPINIVVCGGGLTGVEVAGEIADMSKGKAKVIIVESGKTIMKSFPKKAIDYAIKVLKKKAVEIRTGSRVKKAEKGKIILDNKKEIFTNTIVWCCGIKPPLIVHKMGLRTNERGAIITNEYLQTARPYIYAVGDCAYIYHNPQPQTALTAIQEAETVAKNIIADIKGGEKKVHKPKDVPYLISIGKNRGIMLRKKRVRRGFPVIIIKKFIEKHYLFTRKNWYWPFNKTLK
ncbi:MAG: NAD(P)/FAD-dependent oxidoreductase [archaeon]